MFHEEEFQFHRETVCVQERDAFAATFTLSEVNFFGTPANVTAMAASGAVVEATS